jgi:ubiquinone/menaquinone biosynthesis C-methylase UbiE
MFKFTNYIFRYINLFCPKWILVSYEKIEKLPKIKSGYVDIDLIAKRYAKLNTNFKKDKAVVDLYGFIKNDCRDYLRDIRKTSSVLDIGCGSGLYSEIFRQWNFFGDRFKYTGTEINNKLVKICSKNFPREKFCLAYNEKLPFHNRSYDFVFNGSTIQYSLKMWRKSLKEIARVSKGYGMIVRFPLSTTSKTFYVHQKVITNKVIENHYFVVINKKDFEDCLGKVGFKILVSKCLEDVYKIDGLDEDTHPYMYFLKIK